MSSDPNTATFEPDPNDRPTTGWDGRPLLDETVDKPVASTPGPERADRSTANPPDPPPRREPDLPPVPGYTLEAEIGCGGMGRVYRAVQHQFNRRVALKILFGGGREAGVVRQRFAREVAALGKVDHPNVVPVYAAGEWHGYPFFAMKLVTDGTLADRVAALAGNHRAAAVVVSKIARGVQALHAAGALHRDLKPLNVLMSGDEPVIADFGLALWMADDSDLSVTGSPVGTRQYMPPEQTQGRKEDYGPASDVWSIGIILFELLTGRRPYSHPDAGELYRTIREDATPPMPGVPDGLQTIVRRCLMKAPADRYPSAEAVAVDLEVWSAGGEIPPVPGPRRRWVWAVSAASAVAALVFVMSGGKSDDARKTGDPAPGLDRGDALTFIGERGLPSYVPHPKYPGAVTADPDGYCAVDTASLALIELGKGPFPVAVTFEAEVAYRVGSSLSQAGIYHGRRGTTNGNPHEAMILLSATFVEMETDAPTWKLRADYDATMIRPVKTAPLGRRPIGQVVYFSTPPRKEGAPPAWVPLRVRIEKDATSATAAGKPLGRASAAIGRTSLLLATGEVAGWEFPDDPHADGGFGLFVEAGQFLFRNVRLVPDRPH